MKNVMIYVREIDTYISVVLCPSFGGEVIIFLCALKMVGKHPDGSDTALKPS